MKTKFIATTLLLFIAISAVMAQTERGRFIIGANSSIVLSDVRVKFTGQETDKTTIFKLMPSAGYFLFDNFSVGLSIGYEYQSSNIGAELSALSEFRYYLTSSIVRPYLKANIGYLNIDKSIIGHQYDYDASMHGLKVIGGAGIAIFLRNNISLDLTGQYTLNRLNDLGDGYYESSSNKSFKVRTTTQGLGGFVGLSFYL